MALITPKITVDLPTAKVDISEWKHVHNKPLADPSFNNPGKIDLLIGAKLFFKLLTDGLHHGSADMPTLQNTELGWLVGGRYTLPSNKNTITNNVTCLATCTSTLETAVLNFWNVEEVPRAVYMFKEDIICEEHFEKTHYRESTGRYVVCLPFKESPPSINNSYQLTVKRFQRI